MSQAQRIIDKFDGLSNMARALGYKNPTTVQGWKNRGWIPSKHHARILDVARAQGISLQVSDFIPHIDGAA